MTPVAPFFGRFISILCLKGKNIFFSWKCFLCKKISIIQSTFKIWSNFLSWYSLIDLLRYLWLNSNIGRPYRALNSHTWSDSTYLKGLSVQLGHTLDFKLLSLFCIGVFGSWYILTFWGFFMSPSVDIDPHIE